MFFFQEKDQKTSFSPVARTATLKATQLIPGQEQKFFGSFFQKRTLASSNARIWA
jgi:hypothetical protein